MKATWRQRVVTGAMLVVGLMVAPPAFALDASATPFDRLDPKKWSWAYTSVRRLERSGYFTGSPEGTFDTPNGVTRYEFAIAVESIYRSLQTRILTASEVGQLRQQLQDFRLVLREFTPEIAALGYDVDGMQAQVEVMDQRLTRMEQSIAAAPPAVTPRLALRSGSQEPRSYGVAGALRRSGLGTPLGLNSLPDTLYGPGQLGFTPGLAADLGVASVGLQLAGPNPLDVADVPFENAADSIAYRAQLNLSLGRYLVSAFYDRETGRGDRYGLLNPYFELGASEGVGGALSAQFGSLALRLETASVQSLEDDLAKLTYFKGRLSYELGRYSLDLGYERSRQLSAPGSLLDGIAYSMGIGRSLGRNAHFNVYYRFFDVNGDTTKGTTGVGDSSALTQITVKF